MKNALFASKNVVVLVLSAALFVGFLGLLTPSNTQALGTVTCHLDWSYGATADGIQSYFGVVVPAGTGIRTIGAGSNWSISVTGLQPFQEFRLANTNTTGGGTTYNDFLAADENGNFDLYDNTAVQGYEYGPGVYHTEMQDRSTAKIADCTPSFVIEGPGMTPTPTPVVTPTPTPIITPTPTPVVTPTPSYGPVVCRLNWTNGQVANGSQSYFGVVVPAGTGIRTIGAGSNWSISVTGLQPNQAFRLANTNLTRGGTTYNNFLTADANGNFNLYDNTPVQSYEYSSGVYKTEMQNTATAKIADCTPSFVIADPATPTPTFTSTPSITPTPPVQNCFNIRTNLSADIITNGPTIATARVINNSDCTYTISFVSYKMFDLVLVNQKLFDSVTTTIGPRQTIDTNVLRVNVPNCRYQLDVVEGLPLQPPYSDTTDGLAHAFLAGRFGGSEFCTNVVAVPTVDLKLNGSDGPLTINSGTSANLTWTSNNATSCTATSSPTLAFSGTRAISNTSGESTGVLNQNTSFTITCIGPGGSTNDSVVVFVSNATAQLTCSPNFQTANVNQTVNFAAAGGNGNYVWSTSPSGSPANGSGSAFSTIFTFTGAATATVTSGNQSASCTVNVVNNNQASFSISKRVRNLTQSSGEFSAVSANPGDTLEFAIYLNTFGNGTINNVQVMDSLPSGLRYQTGSTTQDGNNNFVGDGLIYGNGLSLGNLNSGRSIVIRFRAIVENESFFSTGTTTLTNRVTASGNNISNTSDTAGVNVSRINPVINNNQLSVQKFGRNITRGENAELSSITAYPNDTIEFIIHVKNLSGNALYNVNVRDTLPSGLTYINNTTSVDNVVVADGITAGGINLGTFNPFQEKIVKLSARVDSNDNFGMGTTTLNNSVQVFADNVSNLSAQLPISVFKGKVGIVNVGKVQTGGETVLIASLLSALLSYSLVFYGRTYFAQKRGVQGVIRKHANDPTKFNFI